MKKFYYGVVLALLSAVVPIQKNFAQSACPTDRPQKVFNALGFTGQGKKVNFVYIEGFIANANMSLFQGGTIYSAVSFTDATGSGKYVYNGATQNPDQVSSCLGAGCCVKPVPAISACVSNVLNVKYPPNPGAGIPTEICCIYLSNSIASADVKLFDENQSLIPTSSFTNASTDISGFTCYVYPCDKTPTSITACGATGCCSQQVGTQAALPIKLSGFTAKLTADKKARLNWVSELEIGSDKYVIERSADGRNFSPIGEVKSLGNTATTRNYSYNDAGFSTIAFYRLKMVDIDGQVEYSKVVYANNKSGSGVITQIFPNPFKSEIQLIGINSSDLNNKNIRVFSPTGQQVSFQITGANAISLSPGLPSGLYILSVKDQKFKLMKQ